jgi:hypothetical protein
MPEPSTNLYQPPVSTPSVMNPPQLVTQPQSMNNIAQPTSIMASMGTSGGSTSSIVTGTAGGNSMLAPPPPPSSSQLQGSFPTSPLTSTAASQFLNKSQSPFHPPTAASLQHSPHLNPSNVASNCKRIIVNLHFSCKSFNNLICLILM